MSAANAHKGTPKKLKFHPYIKQNRLNSYAKILLIRTFAKYVFSK
ncbi:MAG: hypothetical protein NZ519_03980 [Bacteroidia bacterium]|nr:hypothetical protein [Bacteroidia bacterium]